MVHGALCQYSEKWVMCGSQSCEIGVSPLSSVGMLGYLTQARCVSNSVMADFLCQLARVTRAC